MSSFRFIKLALVQSALLGVFTFVATAEEPPASTTHPQTSAGSQPADNTMDKQSAKAPLPGTPGHPDKRIFGVLPNYRTAIVESHYVPLTNRQKMYIAYKDTTDYPTYFVSAAFAGLNQLDDSNPSFGQGMQGYGKRFGAEVIDQALGNMLTEGILPVWLHEDPRYFQMSEGTKTHRTFYAMSRIFVTKNDSGKSGFNYSEILGNAGATAFSNIYYRDNRDAADNLEKFITQTGTDMISNVLKEFWPDIKRRYWHRRQAKEEAIRQP
jgi:hypothetical protein